MNKKYRYFFFSKLVFSLSLMLPMNRLTEAHRDETVGGFFMWRGKKREVETRHVNGLGFPHYLSPAALLTSFHRGLLNKAIPRVDDLRPRPAQIPQRYRFRFHRDAVVYTTRLLLSLYTQVCACVLRIYIACIEYIVDIAPRAEAWLPVQVQSSFFQQRNKKVKKMFERGKLEHFKINRIITCNN